LERQAFISDLAQSDYHLIPAMK